MKPSGVIIFLIISMIIVLLLIGLIFFFFFFDLKLFSKPQNNYVKYEKKEVIKDKKEEDISDLSSDESKKIVLTTTTSTTIIQNKEILKEKKEELKSQKDYTDLTSDKNKRFKKYEDGENKIKDDVVVTNEKTKSVPYTIKIDSFHSSGEYISDEEHQYRLSLVNNLIIKTVIIDSLTNGNGVSQEFYKVVYQSNMIPAKILEEIVESKEFRKLIPSKYLKEEIKIKGLPDGEKIVFKNSDIRDLLIIWTKGKLTPFQKAWVTKAEK